MSSEVESDIRVARHAQTLIRRGTPPEDALVHAAGHEAQGRLTGVQRVQLAAEGHGRERVPDEVIIQMGEAAGRRANPSGLDFAEKIRICAGTPDGGYEEMRKALWATENVLKGLQTDVATRRRRLADAPPRISPRAPAIPVRPIPRRRPVRPPAPAPAPALPRFFGPGQMEHVDGRHLAASLGFWDFRDRLAGDLRQKKVRPDVDELIDYTAREYGLNPADAAEWSERFLDGVNRDLARRASRDNRQVIGREVGQATATPNGRSPSPII